MDRVIFIQLALPPVVALDGFEAHSELLSASHRFKSHVVLGIIDPKMSKAPEIAGVFNEVQPKDGRWTLEVAVELPDLLPSVDGKSEAVFSLANNDGQTKELCLSNRMSRFHYQAGEHAYHALTPRTAEWHGAAQITAEGKDFWAAEEQLRTLASMRFQVSGSSAENAFESSIRQNVETLLNGVTIAMQAAREVKAGILPVKRALRWDAVATVYVLISGSNAPRGARLILGGSRVALIPPKLDGENALRFRDIVSGAEKIDDIRRLLGEARSSWQDAEYEFAFLQAVIAAEIATVRAVHGACVRRGVSNSKLKDLRKEMTYSLALNVQLPLCFPSANLPTNELVASMNRARSQRNDLMHEGRFNLERSELDQLLLDTDAYIAALRAAEAADGS